MGVSEQEPTLIGQAEATIDPRLTPKKPVTRGAMGTAASQKCGVK